MNNEGLPFDSTRSIVDTAIPMGVCVLGAVILSLVLSGLSVLAYFRYRHNFSKGKIAKPWEIGLITFLLPPIGLAASGNLDLAILLSVIYAVVMELTALGNPARHFFVDNILPITAAASAVVAVITYRKPDNNRLWFLLRGSRAEKERE